MPVPKLVLSLLLALVGALTPAGSPAHAADGITLEAPFLSFRPSSGDLGMYTLQRATSLRISAGAASEPVPDSEANFSWDVQVLRSDMRAATPPAWRTVLPRTTGRLHRFTVGAGQVICVRARQYLRGAISPWSRHTCVVRAREDQNIPHVGPVRLVKDGRYPDGLASVLPAGTRMVLSGVPARAMYGPVFTKPPVGSDGTVCAAPSWRIRGQREADSSIGITSNSLHISFRRTSVAGTALVWTTYPRRCAVGGFVVVPTWVPR